MSVYSTRFFLGTAGTANLIAYTVPVGNVIVLRDVQAFNAGGAADHIRIDPSSSGSQTALISSPTIQAFQWWQWAGRMVVPAGEHLYLVTGANTWDVCLSGYLLS